MRQKYHLRRGAALLLALIITALMSALLSGILLLSVSHLSLSHVDNDYANALNLAEAGVNWELWKLGQDVTTADVTMSPWNQFPDDPNVQRWFRVQVTSADPAGGPWSPPAQCYITAEGNIGGRPETIDGAMQLVGGVNRTVRVMAKGYGLFGKYALYGIHTLNVGGNATINGATGTNGVIDITGNPNFNGNFWYNGSGAIGDSVEGLVTGEIYHTPLPEVYPTVNTVASDWAQAQWGATPPPEITIDFFKTHNNNDQIVNSLGQPVTIKSFAIDNHTFTTDDTIVLTPGDYYFEKINLPSNNTIRIENTEGVVNIWLGPEAGVGKDDTINGSMEFASHDVTRFHFYCGSKRTLKMNGTMDFYGCIFGYNGPDNRGEYYGSIEMNGTGNIVGSVIGYDVTRTTGNATITFQSTGGGPVPGEPVLYWGIEQTWEEVNPL